MGLPDSEEIMTFLRFDKMPARDGHTDRQTDGQTDTLRSLLPALA